MSEAGASSSHRPGAWYVAAALWPTHWLHQTHQTLLIGNSSEARVRPVARDVFCSIVGRPRLLRATLCSAAPQCAADQMMHAISDSTCLNCTQDCIQQQSKRQAPLEGQQGTQRASDQEGVAVKTINKTIGNWQVPGNAMNNCSIVLHAVGCIFCILEGGVGFWRV